MNSSIWQRKVKKWYQQWHSNKSYNNYHWAALLIIVVFLGLVMFLNARKPDPLDSSAAAEDVVLYASDAVITGGDWNKVNDAAVAGGSRLYNPDRGAAKINPALSNPNSYVELTFTAEANVPYHLWLRLRADADSWANDAVYAQFSDSLDSGGHAAYRIGTVSAMTVQLEEGRDAGMQNWGWNDNDWGSLGSNVFFAQSGIHTLRIQQREDGSSIDQIILSPSRFLTVSPGQLKNDLTIISKPVVPPTTSDATEIVIYANDIPAGSMVGRWSKVSDPTAAGSMKIFNSEDNVAGDPKVSPALTSPTDYFEVTFNAVANVPYHLWLRQKALDNFYGNDSVHVQLSPDARNSSGAAAYGIGTNSSLEIVLEEGSGAGISEWGWNDNSWGNFGSNVTFATSGQKTMRVQRREDGVSIDQIVLSPLQYLTVSPGTLKNDQKIVSKTTPTSTTTTLQLAPTSLSFNAVSGTATPPAQNLTLTNSGSASTNWTASTTQSWCQTNPANGSLGTGASSSITVSVSSPSNVGNFTCTITISAANAPSVTAAVAYNVTSAPVTGQTLQLVEYNLAQGYGTDGAYNPGRQITEILKTAPNIVGLVEATDSADYEAKIRSTSGQTWYSYWQSDKGDGVDEGLQILSRFPLSNGSVRRFSCAYSTLSPCQYGAIHAEASVGGKSLHIFVVHLYICWTGGCPDPNERAVQNDQMRQLSDWANTFSGSKIIMGDFNQWTDESVCTLTAMSSSYEDAWAKAKTLGTASAYPDNPVGCQTRTRRGRIDYILKPTSDSKLVVKSATIPDTRDLSRSASQTNGTLDDKGVRPSDHNKVTAVIDFLP
jgi:endonuclease/exonuclease/phosphatase family metal-dependent hydrolase